MRINNNITAMNAHRQYTNNNNAIGKNVAKLSSGYRINSAADDAAGLAISEKMRAQIRGLEMASKNSQDGISLVQTAEGALQTAHDILQRMRELAVQSASDTNETTIDRGALQQEFEALQAELDDISTSTRFNDQNLLDGTFQAMRSTLNNPDTTISNINAISVARAGGGNYAMNVATTAAQSSNIQDGAQCSVFDDGLEKMAAMAAKVNNVTFSGLETSANDGNKYTLQVEGSDIKNMTFHLYDTNNNIVATAQNVDTSTWGTGNNKSANTVSFSGVGTFTFELGKTITSVSDLTSLSGAEIEFLTTGDGNKYEVTMSALTLTDMVTDINTALKSGSISITHNPGSKFDVITNADGTAPAYKTVASLSTTGVLTVNVLDVEGNIVKSGSASVIGLSAKGTAGSSVEIDLGKYGSVKIANDDLANKTAVALTSLIQGGATLTAAATAVGSLSGSSATVTAGTDASNNVNSFTIAGVTGGSATVAMGDVTFASTTVATGGTLKLTVAGSSGEGTYELSIDIDVGMTATAVNTAITNAINAFSVTVAPNDTVKTGFTADSASAVGTTSPVAAIALTGGQEQVSSLSTRAFMTLTINGESVNLYKGDTYANFSEQGIAFEFDALSDADIASGAIFFGAATNEVGGNSGNDAINIAVNDNQGKTLIVQSGANQGDELSINIDRISTETLGISYSNISTRESASKAITEVNDALNQVSTQRAALGALQNRLEYRIQNLDISAENLTAAESRIRDVDMAKEMTEFTKNNIRSQAATAMLAQANALPQNVLQLLG